jgi:hypothetical protein
MDKPKCKLIGTDGNVFALLGKVIKCLKDNGMSDKVNEVKSKLTKCKSYDEALRLFGEYVEIE